MKRSLTAQFVVTFVAVGLLVIAGFAVMVIAARSLRTADRERAQSTTAITTANQLEQSVLDLETGLRGICSLATQRSCSHTGRRSADIPPRSPR